MADRNPGGDVVRRRRQIVDEGLTAGLDGLEQTGNIDNRDALRSGGGQEDLRLVWCNCDAPWQRVITIKFVERNLDGPVDIGAKKRQRVAEDPSVFDMGEGGGDYGDGNSFFQARSQKLIFKARSLFELG